MQVFEKIEELCDVLGRDMPCIVGASKTQDVVMIQQAHAAGLSHIGENYIQEMHEKEQKGAYKGITKCFIGHLQSRKARAAVALCDEIHSVDRIKLAKKLNDVCRETMKQLPVMIQVNQGAEAQKGGCALADLPALVAYVRKACPQLTLTGLMTLPPAEGDSRPYFEALRDLAVRHDIPFTNMGTSADWEEAVRCGATHIRLGTVLFGTRA